MRGTAVGPTLALLVLLAAPLATSSDEDPSPPPCPRRLEAHANGDGSLTVEWQPVTGATFYRVHRATAEGGPAQDLGRVMAPVTSFRDADVQPGVTYRYVVASDHAPEGSASCEGVEATSVPYVAGLVMALGVTTAASFGYLLVAGTRRAPVSRR